MSAPSEILHWCGLCRGEQPHGHAQTLTQLRGTIHLYGCKTCGGWPVEISDPGAKSTPYLTAKRATEEAMLAAWRREDGSNRPTPEQVAAERAQLEIAAAEKAVRIRTPKETKMPKTKTPLLLEKITELIAERLPEYIGEARVREIVREELEAALGLTDGAEPARSAARPAAQGDKTYKCPRRQRGDMHKGRCGKLCV